MDPSRGYYDDRRPPPTFTRPKFTRAQTFSARARTHAPEPEYSFVQMTQDEYEAMEASLDTLRNSNMSLQSEFNKLQRRLEDTEALLYQSEERVERRNDTISDLKAELCSSEDTVYSYQEELERTKIDLENAMINLQSTGEAQLDLKDMARVIEFIEKHLPRLMAPALYEHIPVDMAIQGLNSLHTFLDGLYKLQGGDFPENSEAQHTCKLLYERINEAYQIIRGICDARTGPPRRPKSRSQSHSANHAPYFGMPEGGWQEQPVFADDEYIETTKYPPKSRDNLKPKRRRSSASKQKVYNTL